MATLRVPGAPALPSVRQAPLPGVRVDLDTRDVGTQVAASLVQRAGAEFSAFALKAVESADATATNNSLAELQGYTTQSLTDARDGFLHTQGVQAAERSGKFYADWEAQRQKLREGLNARQREAFDAKAEALWVDTRRQAEMHVVRESRAADAASTQAVVKGYTDAANALSLDDEVGRQGKVLAAVSELRKYGARQGWSPEVVEAEVDGLRAKVAAGVLEQYVDAGKGAEGLKYLASVRELLGAKGAVYEKRLKGAADDTTADTTAATIMTKSRVEGYDWTDPQKAFAEVEALPAGAVKDNVRQRVKELVRTAEGLKERAGNEMLNELIALYQRTGRTTGGRMDEIRRWMLDENNGAADKLNAFLGQVHDRELRDRQANVDARRRQEDIDGALRDKFIGLDDEAKAAVDIDGDADFGKASPRARDLLRPLKRAAEERLRKPMTVADTEFDRMVDKEVGPIAAISGSKEETKKLKSWLSTWRYNYLREHKGQEPTINESLGAIGDALLQTGEGIFRTNKYRYQLKPGEAFDYEHVFPAEEQPSPLNRYPERVKPPEAGGPAPASAGPAPLEIPSDVRALAVQQYKDSHGGASPTETQLQDAWRARLARQAKEAGK